MFTHTFVCVHIYIHVHSRICSLCIPAVSRSSQSGVCLWVLEMSIGTNLFTLPLPGQTGRSVSYRDLGPTQGESTQTSGDYSGLCGDYW